MGMNDHRLWPHMMRKFKASLHPLFFKHFEALHVVHPSWGVRILRLLLWPVAEDDFWDYFYAHERIEFLETYVDMKKFKLPSDIQEYDKWLDKQAAEMNEKAKSSMGTGFGGMGAGMTSPEEEKKHKEQMDELQRLL